ncbi:Formyltransferase/hydrolase complex subunit D [bacterium HR40]|nr:Formyltransferase/hydrolase complex subunit D [bacterium HR40]
MDIDGVEIRDSFAEAFPMRATRILVTAPDRGWLEAAARTATGFATSVIACGVEAGIERWLDPADTPDGRPGVALLFFATSRRTLESQLVARVGQCILTCPGTACYAGIDGSERLPLGRSLRFFGDGHQIAKRFGERRFWRIPVMEGEFLCEHDTGLVTGIGGGNFLILARDFPAASAAARRAVAAMEGLAGIVLPFPGGVVRSGSKVGSRYAKLSASTNDAYCPTLRGRVEHSALPPEVGCVLEIVIDGLSADAIVAGMRAGIVAACAGGRANGVRAIDAGNYGGRLGPHHFRLREVLAA